MTHGHGHGLYITTCTARTWRGELVREGGERLEERRMFARPMGQTMASSYHARMPKEAEVKTFITMADKKKLP